MINDDLLKKISEQLISEFHPQRIILFGSQARGTADERSDVDILVITPINGERRDLMVEMNRALDALNSAFDIVILTLEEFERDRFI
ncbi:MAG TPA: nucleotidyltransferase domain-containing protein, partial [Candidatus Brocadiales bacterium]|nr:nucleotidyltransferase domain-containing protein [Candidatus Brocadiales bacterium]